MPFYLFNWTEDIEAHVAEHGITPEQFDAVVMDPLRVEQSRSSNRTLAYGMIDGELAVCIYDQFDEVSLDPVTAYFVEQ